MADIHETVEKIKKAVLPCGEIMRNAERTPEMTESKEGHANFVTKYDKMIQKILREELLRILPEAVFVGEEDDVHAQIEKGYSFIVDPIDGTTNFIRDIARSSISVALLLDGEQLAAVCYDPYREDLFTAIRGEGAFRNGSPIHVSDRPLSESLVLFGTAPYYPELSRKTFELCSYYLQSAMDLRRQGSSVLDLCDVACGRAERFFELRLSPWDYAAASLIVREAGGIVTTVEGTPLTMDRPCSVYARNRD